MRVVNHERVNLYSGALIQSHYSTETAAGATGEPKPAKNDTVLVKKEEEPAATGGTTSGKKVPVKKGKGTMEAKEVKELKGKLNGMKHKIETLSKEINGIIEGLPADPE